MLPADLPPVDLDAVQQHLESWAQQACAAETVEVLELRDGVYAHVASAQGDAVARLPPFHDLPLDVSRWWMRRPDAPS